MTVHPQCQPIADAIAALETQRATAQAAVPGLPPLDRWKALVQIGDLGRQILEQQLLLDECQRQHQAAYEADVVLFDTSNAPPGARTATLWSMEGVPTELESVPITGGVFGFVSHPTDVPIGITVQEIGNPAVQGVDFRSGTLEELPRDSPQDPSGRIEIVVGPTLTITAGDLTDWLAAIPLPMSTTADIPPPTGGRADITVSSLSVTLLAGAADVVASGTAHVTGSLWGSLFAPFKLDLPVGLALPHTPDATHGCDVLIQGSPSLNVSGPLGSVLTMIAQTFVDLIGGQALSVLRDAFNRVLPDAVASLYGLGEPPPDSVVSLRRFEISPIGIVIEPTIGALGDVLSTFVP